ncbi:PPC domain-containing protein, partial [Paramaledivibacter caminithermalis]
MNLKKIPKNILSLVLVLCMLFSSTVAYALESTSKSIDERSEVLISAVSKDSNSDNEKEEFEYIESNRYIENSDELLPFRFVSELDGNDVSTTIKFYDSIPRDAEIDVSISKEERNNVFSKSFSNLDGKVSINGIESDTIYDFDIVITYPDTGGETSEFYMGKYTLVVERNLNEEIVCIEDNIKDVYYNRGHKSPQIDKLIEEFINTTSIDKSNDNNEIDADNIDLTDEVLKESVKADSLIIFEQKLLRTEFRRDPDTINRYEVEPNDSFSKADRFYDDDTVGGKIQSSGDEDYYKIKFDKSGLANFWLGYVPKTEDYKLYLYDYDHNRIGRSVSGGNGVQELIPEFPVESGKYYYVRIKGDSSSDYDNSQYYHLRAKLVSEIDEEGDEYEPNDSFDDATRLSGNYNKIYATLHNEDDDDYYRIRVGENSTVTIDLTNIPRGENYKLKLYDSDHDRIAYSNESGNEDEQIIETVDSGTYYIRVYPYKDSYDADDEYKLTINIEEESAEEEIVYKMTYEGKDIYLYGVEGNDLDNMYAIVADEDDSEGKKWVYSEIGGWYDTSLYASVPTDGGIIVSAARTSLGNFENSYRQTKSVKKIAKIVEINLSKIKDKLQDAMIEYIGIDFSQLSSQNVKMIAGGLGSSVDDNVFFGLAKKVTGKEDYEDNYFYMRAKVFADSCFVAAYATATLGSAAEAARALANAGVAGGFALATGGVTSAAAVEELARSAALAGVSFISSKLMKRSQDVLSKSTESLRIKHVYDSIKKSPAYPKGFKPATNGTK